MPSKPLYDLIGFNIQSDELPSACCVELPSKDHIGGISESVTWILLRRLGSGL